MKRTVRTSVIRTEEVEHVYCNKCGNELGTKPRFRKDVEISIDVEENIQMFVLCFECVVNWLIPNLKYPPDEIDMREG